MRANFLELPIQVRKVMLRHQKEQTGQENEDVFIRSITASSGSGGFDWDMSPEGMEFWDEVLLDDVNAFYDLYPKSLIKEEYEHAYRKLFKTNLLPTEITEDIKENLRKHDSMYMLWEL